MFLQEVENIPFNVKCFGNFFSGLYWRYFKIMTLG